MKKQLATLVTGACAIASAFAENGGTIADFEDSRPVKTGGSGAMAAELITDKEHVKEGATALKLVVNYGGPGSTGTLGFKIPPAVRVAKETGKVSLWIFGDGGGASLSFNLEANDKGLFTTVKKIDWQGWQGWQEVVIPMSEFQVNKHSTTTPPDALKEIDPNTLRAFSIIVYKGIGSVEDKHTFYIDSIKLVP